MLSDILDNSMDQETISGPSGCYESQNPIDESELQIHKSTRKGYLNDQRLRIMFSWYVSPTEFDEPDNVLRHYRALKKGEWLKAMKEELESIKTNEV